MFGQSIEGASCGLFEVSVGKNGISSRIGTGGTDISFGTLRSAAAGTAEAKKITSWKYGDEEKRSTLNSINMLGWTDNDRNRSLSKDIWNGKLKVEYGDTGSDYGNYTVGEDKIRLSDKLLGGGKEASAKLATVMAHEGTHYYGNRIEGVAHSVGFDTYAQINKMFNLEGEASFAGQMIDEIMNKDSWKENTGDVDHWTLKDDGSLAYDGKADLFDENGNLIYETKKRGLEGSFIEILYGENATKEQKEAARDLLEKNFSHYAKGEDEKNRDNWYWNTTDNIGKSMSVDQYEEIYKNRVLTDSVTGVTATIEQHNPVNIYKRMVANGTMDIRPGLGNVPTSVFYALGDRKYISYEEFKANNYITGGMPKYTINTPIPEGSYISTLFGAVGIKKDGGKRVHAGIDFAVPEGTEVYPMLVNDKTKVYEAHDEDRYKETIQGKHVLLRSDFSYNYKGAKIKETITQSYDHLLSTSLKKNDSIATNTLLGLSGNTGKWGNDTYKAHLHVDVYTDLKSSPLLNYFNMKYDNVFTSNLSHQSSLNTKPMRYYDPYAILRNYKYKIRDDAYRY